MSSTWMAGYKKRQAFTREVEDMICGMVQQHYGEGGFQNNPNYFDLPRLLARLLDEHDALAHPWEPSSRTMGNVMAEYVRIKARRNERAIRLIHDELVKRGRVGQENEILYNDLDNRLFALPTKEDHVRAFVMEDQNLRFVVVSDVHDGEEEGDEIDRQPFGHIAIYRYWDVIDQTGIDDRLEEMEGKCPVLESLGHADWDVVRWGDSHSQYSKRPPLKLFADWLMGGPVPDSTWVREIFQWDIDPDRPIGGSRDMGGESFNLCSMAFMLINASCCELGIEDALADPRKEATA